MAGFRLSAQVIKRSAGRSAVAAAAYRSGERLRDERTGEAHDYTRKGGIVHTEILAPSNAPEWMVDRDQLWNAVEKAERRTDAQLAREIQISLPHELSADDRLQLARQFVTEQFVERGMIADMAIHEPDQHSDDRNHHAHIMLTMRELAGEGFGKKVRDWNSPDMLENWRERWAHHQNREFERRGLEVRVDHRSFQRQGLDREPTQHLGPTAADMERRGRRSRIGDENRGAAARNTQREKLENQRRVIDLAIEREKRRFESWAGHKKADQHSRHLDSQVQLGRRQVREKTIKESVLEKQYGPHRKELTGKAKELDARLEVRGPPVLRNIRKVARDLLGRTRSDQRDRENVDRSLKDIDRRKSEVISALGKRQADKVEAQAQKQAREQSALERGIEKARARREAEGWKPQQPGPDGSAREKSRSALNQSVRNAQSQAETTRDKQDERAPANDHEPPDMGRDFGPASSGKGPQGGGGAGGAGGARAPVFMV